MDNLPELRDIHIPDGVSMFPLAYGWWLVILAIIIAITLYKYIKSFIKNSKKRYAIKIINQIDINTPTSSAIIISETLRRICIYKYPKAKNLIGQDWIDFLIKNCHCEERSDVAIQSKKYITLLLNAPYIKKDTEQYSKKDILSLSNFAKKWIGENL